MRQKLQLRTNAWIRFRFILLATLLFSSFQSYAELGQTDLDEIKKSPFFKNRYTMGMVWDCDRSPSDAIAGVEWKLDNFKAPYDASLRDVPIDFGDKSDRYVQFDIEDWNSDLNPDYNYITDNSGNELVISLKLYEVDGTIHAGEIESLTIGTTTASTIDILIKETTVKTGGVTLVTDKTTATLTLSGANDLGPVTNNGLGVPYRFAVRTNPPMVKRHSMNPEITVAW